MNISVRDLLRERHDFGRARQSMVRAGIVFSRSRHVNLTLVEAFASRETNMQNITGDGGHGRGFVQVDDRFHADWLRGHVGCRNGTTIPVFASALPAGRVPTIFAGTVFLCRYFEQAIAEAARLGVRADGSRTRFALAAWNAGLGGATLGWHEGDVDRHTAGGDYSRDVVDRLHVLRTN